MNEENKTQDDEEKMVKICIEYSQITDALLSFTKLTVNPKFYASRSQEEVLNDAENIFRLIMENMVRTLLADGAFMFELIGKSPLKMLHQPLYSANAASTALLCSSCR